MEIYVVQPGDSVYSIAGRYGISFIKLILDNGLENINSLVPGQAILIAYPSLTYTVKEGDSLKSIADTYGVSLSQLLRNNPYLAERTYIYKGETLTISYNTVGKMTTNGFIFPFVDREILRKTLPYLTYLTIYNYRITSSGDLLSYFDDSEIIQIAKEYGTIPLMMATTFSPEGEPDIESMFNLLLSEEYQEKQINTMLNVIKEKGYYGVNFIFNYINVINQKLYQSFLTKVYNRLSDEGYLVFATINPKINNINNEIYYEKIDYSAISQVVNYIIFLELIWGTNFEPPEPVSSIRNLKTFMDYVTNQIPPEKAVIGMPVIGYDWVLPHIPGISKASALTINSAINLANDVGATIQFDEVSQTPFYYYYSIENGLLVQHIVWFIDARSISALTNLFSEYGLSGTGIWSVMTFLSQLWTVLNTQYDIEKFLPENTDSLNLYVL